jgi:hypothetical protein
VSDALNNHHSTPPPAQATTQSEPVDGLTSGDPTLATALQELVAILPSLRDALDRQTAAGLVEPLLTRRDLSRVLRVSLPVLDRLKASGRLPKPDLVLSRRSPRWRATTIRRWVEEGGRP